MKLGTNSMRKKSKETKLTPNISYDYLIYFNLSILDTYQKSSIENPDNLFKFQIINDKFKANYSNSNYFSLLVTSTTQSHIPTAYPFPG